MIRSKKIQSTHRRGAALVLFLMSLTALIAFLALAIDLGLVAVARTQCQDAADAAAMAGTRTLDGDTTNNNNNNYSNAGPTAITTAKNNSVLGAPVTASQVSVQIGRYSYVQSQTQFQGQVPGPSSENWSMVQATVTANVASQLAFSKAIGLSPGTIQATATAAHRPRDVAVILDYSGSMRFASLLGDPYYGDRSSNNPDTVIPTFGHYSATSSAALTASSFTLPYAAANISTTTSDGRPPIVGDFYTNSTGTLAFSAQPSSYGTTPSGDNFFKTNKNTGASYAVTVKDLLNLGSVSNSTRDVTFETLGYKAYAMKLLGTSGYTVGPGYYGKSFFLWPPDPTNDWRAKYFNYSGNGGAPDNAKLWDSSGNWQAPGTGGSDYQIDYPAILNFIKNVGPNPFPSQLQSGRIKYYTQIPSTIDTSTFQPSDLNQRFWKQYIDYVLGLVQTSNSNWSVIVDGNTGLTGYGADYQWGTVSITAYNNLSGNPKPYMRYDDNPLRPGLHFWFGPMTMVDFLGNYNLWGNGTYSPNSSRFCWWPGTCHESPLYECKLGIRAALNDISQNHPNDSVAMIMFSAPEGSAGDGGRFNRVRVGLGRDYADMQDALWYPPSTYGNSSATVTPYDAKNLEVPRAYGSTCYAMPLMLAFNQFSGNTSLQSFNPGAATGDAGGLGRKGAQKIIIFETDGAPNTTASAAFVDGGAYNSYYRVRYNSSSPSASDFPTGINGYSDNSSSVTSPIYTLVQQVCALDTASPSGYSTASKPALVHCIGFGPEFDPSNSHAATNTATLNQIQQYGNVTDGMPGYKIVYGSQAQVAADLQQAFTQILQTGVQVSLIR